MTTKQAQQIRNPLAIREGDDKGKMPHELSADDFLCWQIEQGMTDEDYKLTIESIKEYLLQIKSYGYPIPTAKLTDDQAGWARSDHKLHYDSAFAKWFIRPEKPSRPIPAQYRLRRSRGIREDCDCAAEGIQEYSEWGTFHDGRTMYQCEACGEVVVDPKEDHHGLFDAA